MGPLEGLKIIEFAGLGPGPFCGMMLADMGADVVRIDRPKGQHAKSGKVAAFNLGKFDVLGRNRRVLHLDIKDPVAKAQVMDLISEADGLIEGFRPGVMEKLGLGPDECLARNKGLVYGRMTGWGQDGPMSKIAGHDVNYIALNGVLNMIGNCGEKPAIPPTLVGDMGGGGMFLAFGMLAGILSAKNTGKGQVVDAAIVDGSALLASILWAFKGIGHWGERGTNLVDGGPHFYDTFECSDGKYFSLGAIEPVFYKILLEKLGLSDDADFEGQMDASKWPEKKEKLAAIFKAQPRDHWSTVFEGSDACAWPVLSAEESRNNPQIAARGIYTEVDGVTQPAPAPKFSETPGEIKFLAGGEGENIDDILSDWAAKS